MPTLDELERLYFDPNMAPIDRANTVVTPIVDGKFYFPEIARVIDTTRQSGDCIYQVGWEIELDWDLKTGQSDPSGPIALGEILFAKAAVGVDVRVILNGLLIMHDVEVGLPFKRNLAAAEGLRSRTDEHGRAWLADKILWDWSGARLSGSHHQKAWVILASGILTAFVGGMDSVAKKWDWPPHNHKEWIGSVPPKYNDWGWHDVGVKLEGEGARRVWENFARRWEEARTLPSKSYWVQPPTRADPVGIKKFFNPTPVVTTPGPAPAVPTPSVSTVSVQVLESRYHHKIPDMRGGGTSWTGVNSGGVYQVFGALQKAIASATTYIYMEDQFLQDMPVLEAIPTDATGYSMYSLYHLITYQMLRKPQLRLIMVGSGRGDPGDPVGRRKNSSLTSTVQDDIVFALHSIGQETNVAVFRLELATVHAKVILIDDEFAAIGSANAQSRSMYGIDQELHTVFVSSGDDVQRLRMQLWAEHWDIPLPLNSSPELLAALRNLPTALGLWRSRWLPEGVEPGTWRTQDKPRGFTPTSHDHVLPPLDPLGDPLRLSNPHIRFGWLNFVGPGNDP